MTIFNRSRLTAALAATAVFATACSSTPPSDPPRSTGPGPIARDDGWKNRFLSVPGEFARPVAVKVEGAAATDPDGIKTEGGTATTITKGTRLVLDLGVPVSGYVEIGVKSASGGPIRAAYAEYDKYLGREGDASTKPDDFFYKGRTLSKDDDPDGRADVFKAPRGETVLRSPGLRGSQRYIGISLDGPGTATIDYVRVKQTNYTDPHDGYFLSSDEQLNDAWYASAYGMNLSTIRDQRRHHDGRWVIVDGPKRDRIPYVGDLRVVAQAAYYQSAAYREIVRDTINLFACQQLPDGTFPASSVVDVPCDSKNPGPPDGSPKGFEVPGEAGLARIDSFTAWWVIDVADYLRYSGDAEFAKSMLPAARRAVQFFIDHSPDGALFRTDNYGGKPAYNWHTPDPAVGVDAYSNEAFYGALRSLAELERAVGKDSAATPLDQRAEKVRTALIDKLWDPAVGAMRLNSDDPKRDHTADANAGALLFGLLDEQQAKSAMAFLRDQLGTQWGTLTTKVPDNKMMTQYISPYLLAQESLGRMQYGDSAGALDLIRQSWSHMLRNGPGTAWEEIGVDGTPSNARPGTALNDGSFVDLVHAWSTAVPALSMHVLGAQPATAGYREWRVQPEVADLKWAQGDVPTPAGPLSVRWKHEADTFTLTVEAPADTTGSVAIPLLGKDRTISLDGQVIWQDGKSAAGAQAHQDGDKVIVTGLSGNHTASW